MAKKGAPRRKRVHLCSALVSEAEIMLKAFRKARKEEKLCASKATGSSCDLSHRKAVTQEASGNYLDARGMVEDYCGRAAVNRIGK
jgi:hypothetical protein